MTDSQTQLEATPHESSTVVAEGVSASACEPNPENPRRILVLSAAFPSSVMPTFGVFVKERIRALANLPGYEVRVIAPVPYFPPIKRFKKWYGWSQVPSRETIDGLDVIRPRYPMPPKIGGYLHSYLMYPSVLRAAKQIRREFDFDIIDSHFVYPAGVVGTMLGKRFKKPVMITGRGEDILSFPALPVIGSRIRWALKNADQLVALSKEIAAAMEANGATPDKISLIPNGVDCDKFHPVPQTEARNMLGLPLDRKIIVTVGNRQERKGFHILIDALPKIREQHPDAYVVIVGGPAPYGNDHTEIIEQRIREHGLEQHVRLAGHCEHDRLKYWYSAADLFALLTSREGSPNVLLEALACGVPAVATPVGGIPEVLADQRLGYLLPERSPEAAAVGIKEALSHSWDRGAIRGIMTKQSWRETAKQVTQALPVN